MIAKSAKAPRLARTGEAFAIPLGSAGFGVVRVLRTVRQGRRNSALVAVTPWLAPHIPDIGEPVLREILRKHFGNWQGQFALCWYEGSVPADLQCIGTIPPTDGELAIDPRGTYCGWWDLNMANDVLRARGLPVAPVPSAPSRDDVDRVTGVMSEDDFWKAIQRLDWSGDTDEQVVAPLLKYLVKQSVASIAGFHRKLCEKLFALDREEFAREIGEHSYGSSRFSPDHFLDLRCAAVGRGRTFYDELLSDPSRMIRDRDLEALATVAEEAYEEKVGRAVVFLGAKSYETFSNRQGWSATEA